MSKRTTYFEKGIATRLWSLDQVGPIHIPKLDGDVPAVLQPAVVLVASCEPPPEFEDARWHWIARHGHGKEPFRWEHKRRLWWTGFGSFTPEVAAQNGWTYWAPIAPPPTKPVKS